MEQQISKTKCGQVFCNLLFFQLFANLSGIFQLSFLTISAVKVNLANNMELCKMKMIKKDEETTIMTSRLSEKKIKQEMNLLCDILYV